MRVFLFHRISDGNQLFSDNFGCHFHFTLQMGWIPNGSEHPYALLPSKGSALWSEFFEGCWALLSLISVWNSLGEGNDWLDVTLTTLRERAAFSVNTVQSLCEGIQLLIFFWNVPSNGVPFPKCPSRAQKSSLEFALCLIKQCLWVELCFVYSVTVETSSSPAPTAPPAGRELHTEPEIFIRNVCTLKNKYDLTLCQSRLHV